MKRVTVILLLLGYLFLTPFCFLAENKTHAMPSMPGMEGTMPGGASSPITAASEHLGMYISLTGSFEHSFLLLVISFLIILVIVFALPPLATFPPQVLTYFILYAKSDQERLLMANRGFVNWLSLSRLSPPRVSRA